MLPSLSLSSTPPRRHRPSTTSGVSSPKSVVWQVNAVEQDQGNSGLPSVKKVESELKWLSKQKLTSRASYNEKLGMFASELKGVNSEVYALQQQLEAAMAKQAMAQKAIEQLKHDRECEVERLEVRRMQMTILKACAEDADLVPEIIENPVNDEESVHDPKQQQMLQRQYSDEELKAVRGPLEKIYAILADAKKAERSKDAEERNQALTLKQQAITKYVLFQRAHNTKQ